ncbi:MAG: alpha-E domain-containing protein [Sulfuritalea sp.]|nr:alpha-E domain-containing protein [Sulfuritalea sp.]MDP1983744.1 alpha-E domain-containing protein [Sulfuritalea sp.]
MLSSTADHLYWLGRGTERAENTARMLDVTYRMSLLKQAVDEPHHEWRAMLSISGLHEDFEARYDEPSAANVMHFMALDEKNPGSIYNSLYTARENARAIRGAITSEMWEALNSTWLEMRRIQAAGIAEDGVASFFEWVKERSHLSRGIAHGTLLRDDIFRFLRLGTFFERADNTARILDVKYHILLPSVEDIGGAADYYHWGALLRSVSAFESYRKVYRDLITPRRVAELLILRPDMPRSLMAAMNEVNRLVQEINGPRAGELLRRCGLLHSELRFGTIDDIFARGLHEYLSEFLERIYDLGDLINTTYFWTTDEWPNALHAAAPSFNIPSSSQLMA